MAMNPMEQFTVKPLVPLHIGGYDVSFTNQSLLMVIVAVGGVAVSDARHVEAAAWCRSRAQSMAEMSYEFVANMIHSATGEDGLKFFPFVFTLFMFVLCCNFFGMMPGSLHGHQPDRGDLRAGRARHPHGHRDRLRQARHRLSQAVRAARALVSADPAGADRGDLVPDPPDQPFGASVRQHAGRPHHAGGVRRLRHRCSAAPAACCRCSRSRRCS